MNKNKDNRPIAKKVKLNALIIIPVATISIVSSFVLARRIWISYEGFLNKAALTMFLLPALLYVVLLFCDLIQKRVIKAKQVITKNESIRCEVVDIMTLREMHLRDLKIPCLLLRSCKDGKLYFSYGDRIIESAGKIKIKLWFSKSSPSIIKPDGKMLEYGDKVDIYVDRLPRVEIFPFCPEEIVGIGPWTMEYKSILGMSNVLDLKDATLFQGVIDIPKQRCAEINVNGTIVRC